MTVVQKKTVLALLGVALLTVADRAHGSHGPGAPSWVSVTPTQSQETLTPADRDVIEAIRGTTGDTPSAIEAYATFQRGLKTLFEDSGMEPGDFLARLDTLIESLGSGRLESFASIHEALAVRYPDAEGLRKLLAARSLNTDALLAKQPPSAEDRAALEGRVRRFALLTHLSDETAREFLERYHRAVREQDVAEQGRALAEILTAQGKRFRRILTDVLSSRPADVGNGSLERDLLAASRWVEGLGGADNPLKQAFVEAYAGEDGSAASNRNDFWGLVEQSESARADGNTQRVEEISETLRRRWGGNLGAFLEGMRDQAVASDATEPEKEQARNVLNRITAALGEERTHGDERQIVVRTAPETEPVVVHHSTEGGGSLWNPESWDVAEQLTRHFADRQDAFERSQLLNTVFRPLPGRSQVPVARAEPKPDFVPEIRHAVSPEGTPPTATPPAREGSPRPKLKLTLMSCMCVQEWFGSGSKYDELRERPQPYTLTEREFPPNSLGEAVKKGLEASGYDVELTWMVNNDWPGAWSLHGANRPLFTSLAQKSFTSGFSHISPSSPEEKRMYELAGFPAHHETKAGVEEIPRLGQNSQPKFRFTRHLGLPGVQVSESDNPVELLNEAFNPEVVRNLDWGAILDLTLPSGMKVVRR